jgi:hypothetical protein
MTRQEDGRTRDPERALNGGGLGAKLRAIDEHAACAVAHECCERLADTLSSGVPSDFEDAAGVEAEIRATRNALDDLLAASARQRAEVRS